MTKLTSVSFGCLIHAMTLSIGIESLSASNNCGNAIKCIVPSSVQSIIAVQGDCHLSGSNCSFTPTQRQGIASTPITAIAEDVLFINTEFITSCAALSSLFETPLPVPFAIRADRKLAIDVAVSKGSFGEKAEIIPLNRDTANHVKQLLATNATRAWSDDENVIWISKMAYLEAYGNTVYLAVCGSNLLVASNSLQLVKDVSAQSKSDRIGFKDMEHPTLLTDDAVIYAERKISENDRDKANGMSLRIYDPDASLVQVVLQAGNSSHMQVRVTSKSPNASEQLDKFLLEGIMAKGFQRAIRESAMTSIAELSIASDVDDATAHGQRIALYIQMILGHINYL